MKKVVVTLKSMTPYSPSRRYDAEVEKLKDESKDEYDERTWRNHAHVNRKTGNIVIPSDCFSWSLKAMAQRRSDKIPGKGKQTYTKVFGAIEVLGEIDTRIKPADVECEAFMANSDGKRGSGSRVYRRFPRIPEWSGTLTFLSWDDQLNEEVFAETIRDAGLLIGVGRRRPEKQGCWGRYTTVKIDWHDRVEISAALFDAAAE